MGLARSPTTSPRSHLSDRGKASRRRRGKTSPHSPNSSGPGPRFPLDVRHSTGNGRPRPEPAEQFLVRGSAHQHISTHPEPSAGARRRHPLHVEVAHQEESGPGPGRVRRMGRGLPSTTPTRLAPVGTCNLADAVGERASSPRKPCLRPGPGPDSSARHSLIGHDDQPPKTLAMIVKPVRWRSASVRSRACDRACTQPHVHIRETSLSRESRIAARTTQKQRNFSHLGPQTQRPGQPWTPARRKC